MVICVSYISYCTRNNTCLLSASCTSLIFFSGVIGGLKNVSLIWSCNNGNLTLTCEVPNPKLGIYIRNQSNDQQGYCLTYPTIFCHNSSGNISYNSSTNQTIFTVKIKNKESVNGKWTCANGSGEEDKKSDLKVDITCKLKINASNINFLNIISLLCVFVLQIQDLTD